MLLRSGRQISTNQDKVEGVRKMEREDNQVQEERHDVLQREQNIAIVAYDPNSKLNFSSWIEYFERKTIDRSEEWKMSNLSNYLKEPAFSFYVNECLNTQTFDELITQMKDRFDMPITATFSELNNTRYKTGMDINEYYVKKIDIAKKLNLSTTVLMEALTDGLSGELKKLLTITSPLNPNEWLQNAVKVIKLEKENQLEENATSAETSRVEQERHWRRPTHNSVRQYVPVQPRGQFQSYDNHRLPYRPNDRQPRPHGYTQRPLTYQPRNYQNQTRVHYQSALPKTPCKFCTSRNITNAFHWHSECQFKENASERRNPVNVNEHVENNEHNQA